ncbi:hypothetical protein AB0H82_35695 [Streptomyces sp. NPDC050732]|uniref:hypothetical protein n=1 Tax=Streptomyces sp. NPDC050732 TaxID=3154632 RepID=UPI003422EB14
MTRTKKAFVTLAVAAAVAGGAASPALADSHLPASPQSDSHLPAPPGDSHLPVTPQGDSHLPAPPRG